MAVDCSFIPKSGNKTYGLDYFYNGSVSKAEKGLEISAMAVVDVKQKISFSLSVQQTPPNSSIYLYYKARFQIEFIFRDSKQFTGLADCQARDLTKLDFHFNSSLTVLNLAKWDSIQRHNSDTDFVFSMASYKRRGLNYHLLERFIDKLDLEPTLIKSHPNYSNLCKLTHG